MLDGFEDVVGENFVRASEVGDGAGDFLDTVIGAGGEPKALGALVEKLRDFIGELYHLSQVFHIHFAVG